MQLGAFDVSKVKPGSVVVVIGSRGTGKSFLVRDLLHRLRDLPHGTVVSPTEEHDAFFGRHVPRSWMHSECTPALLERVVERQRRVIREGRGDPRAFLLLHECVYGPALWSDRNMRALFVNGRCLKLTLIVTMQYALGIPPVLRPQIDQVFITRNALLNNRRRLHELYAGAFPSLDDFCAAMEWIACADADPYRCLVVDNTARSNRLEDIAFFFKAEPRPDLRMGAEEVVGDDEEVAQQLRAEIDSLAKDVRRLQGLAEQRERELVAKIELLNQPR